MEHSFACLGRLPRETTIWLMHLTLLGGSMLSLQDKLRLMASVDDLLFSWPVDLLLRYAIPDDLTKYQSL